MVKKLLTISLAFLYLLFSSGLLVEVHHCMGRIADSRLHAFTHTPQDGYCGKCGMEKGMETSHCCKDEVKLVKVEDDQKAVGTYFQLDAPVLVLQQTPVQYWLAPSDEVVTRQLPPATGPPIIPPAFQELYCIFRI